MTFESVQISADLLEYLLSRLRKKGAHSKIKTLKILRHLVDKGHESVVTDLRRRTTELRDAQSMWSRKEMGERGHRERLITLSIHSHTTRLPWSYGPFARRHVQLRRAKDGQGSPGFVIVK